MEIVRDECGGRGTEIFDIVESELIKDNERVGRVRVAIGASGMPDGK